MIMREYQKLTLDKLLPIQSTNLPIVNEDDAPPEGERLYTRFCTDFGRPRVPGILQCFATHPPLLEHMMGLAQSMLFVEGALDRQHKEMIATFVSSLKSCDYCADSHGFFLRANDGSPELFTAVMECEVDSKEFTSQQGSLFRFVQKITDGAQSVTRRQSRPLSFCSPPPALSSLPSRAPRPWLSLGQLCLASDSVAKRTSHPICWLATSCGNTSLYSMA